MFLEGRRVDMRAIAAELAVSRTTLYRWTGSRDRLLGDILFSLSDDLFQRARSDHPEHTGAERLVAIFRQHVGALVRARPLQVFVQQETHAALRILTSRDGYVHPRTVKGLVELLREEQDAGSFCPDTDLETLAYAIVRVTEGFIYNDAIAAVEPEDERAAIIYALLLR